MAEAHGSLHRAIAVLRSLGAGEDAGLRLTELAAAVDLPRPTAHRLLKSLVSEGIVAFDARTKRYSLGLELFLLGARAGNVAGLRDICRPTLLRLTGTLGETLFLLVRNGYEAVCIDRSAGPLPIRSFTGDIGGKVMLGVGQGSTAILAFLPPDEQDEVIRRNLPRMQEMGDFDEASLRGKLADVRQRGYCYRWDGLIPGMAGLGVPILDRRGYPLASISIGTTTDRLTEERSIELAKILQGEVRGIAERVNPFDPTLRRASAAMEMPRG
ncbi:MAG: IclR family transcriptional regulator [Rhizobiales bacterium]|nr:IclR family transcriptional regulator [Hyphomicrobiales bacterium]